MVKNNEETNKKNSENIKNNENTEDIQNSEKIIEKNSKKNTKKNNKNNKKKSKKPKKSKKKAKKDKINNEESITEINKLDINLDNNSIIKEKMPQNIGKTIATKIPLNMYEEISYLIENGAYLSISDFLRESMREHLKTVSVHKTRNITYKTAKKEILSYFKEYKDCYLDEIVFDLNIDFELASKVIDILLLEKQIKLNDFSTLDPDINFDSKFKKIAGKRLIVEAKSVDNEYLRLKETKSVSIKNKGFILENGVVIVSNHYSYIK